jgi:hypothetical protein
MMSDEMTQEIAVREPMQIAQVAQLMSIQDVQQTAKAIVTSKMIAGVENESQAIVKILAGQELGLGPIASVNGLYVLNGRVGMMASVAGALLQKGGYHWTSIWDDVDNPTACEITFYGPTLPPEGWVNRFTVADAIRAKLIKQDGAHQKYPKDMLFNRAFMAGARKVAPSCLLNMGYEYDELKEATMPPHLAGAVPPPAVPVKPAAAPASAPTVPYGVLPPDVECPVHPGMFFKMNQWNKYTHPTNEKNDKGKTIWCSKEKVMPVDAPAVESVEVVEETPPAALEVPSSTDWSKATQADYFKALDKAILDKGLPTADVKAIMLDQFGYTKRTEITIAKRNDVLKALIEFK